MSRGVRPGPVAGHWSARLLRLALLGALAALPVACGKKGPPLAPLHLVPGPPVELTVRRTGPEARLQFVLPAGNVNGAGPSVLDRVHIYAVTLSPGMGAPPNRELLTPPFLVGSVSVEPPPVEGESPPPDAPPDARPSPGEPVTFVELLTPDKVERASAPVGRKDATTAAAVRATGLALLTTALGTVPARNRGAAFAGALSAVPAAGPLAVAASFGLAAAEAVTAAIPKHAVRLYAVQGVSRGGRPGQVSARAELPIVPLPPVPSAAMAVATEKAIAVTWIAGAVAAATFNVYTADGQAPLNEAPIAAPPYERPGVSWGVEQCFVVRAVDKVGTAAIESEPSKPACVTPRDTFPPAAPAGLSVVAGPGTINLSWDASGEPDLGGYIVLRGEAPGDTLRPITPAAIAATNYEDRTAQPGMRYVYSIEAIDTATPPNRSAASARVEETAR